MEIGKPLRVYEVEPAPEPLPYELPGEEESAEDPSRPAENPGVEAPVPTTREAY